MKIALSQVLHKFQIYLLPILPNLAFAVRQHEATGIGLVAKNLMEPIGLMSDFVYSASVLIGGLFVFTSFLKYIEHRRSPLHVPLSTPIVSFISGVTLMLLPMLALYNEHAVRYTFFR